MNVFSCIVCCLLCIATYEQSTNEVHSNKSIVALESAGIGQDTLKNVIASKYMQHIRKCK